MIYLDYAATSYKKPEAVYRAVESVLRRGASVGRGGYPASRFSAERVFACREELRRLFSAPYTSVNASFIISSMVSKTFTS